jgi:hypothetical protein
MAAPMVQEIMLSELMLSELMLSELLLSLLAPDLFAVNTQLNRTPQFFRPLPVRANTYTTVQNSHNVLLRHKAQWSEFHARPNFQTTPAERRSYLFAS